jgi:hypothetical protein
MPPSAAALGDTLLRWARPLQRRKVTALLVGLLLADAAYLAVCSGVRPRPSWSGSSSAVGTALADCTFGHYVSFHCDEPIFPTGYFVETPEGFRFFGSLSMVMQLELPEETTRPMHMVKFHFIRHTAGLWAPITEHVQGWLEAEDHRPCTPATAEKIRLAARGHMAEMEYRPRYARDCERIAEVGDFDEEHLLLGGLAHNAVALTLAALTVASLASPRGHLARWLFYIETIQPAEANGAGAASPGADPAPRA